MGNGEKRGLSEEEKDAKDKGGGVGKARRKGGKKPTCGIAFRLPQGND